MGVVKIFCDRLNKEKDLGKPVIISHACLFLALGTKIRETIFKDARVALTNYMLRCGNRCDGSGSLQLLGGTELH